MDIRNIATFLAGFPSGGAAKGTESSVLGNPSAVLNKGIHAGFGAGDRKRGVAAASMTRDADAFALDVGTERLVFQYPVNDAGNLLGPADPHAD